MRNYHFIIQEHDPLTGTTTYSKIHQRGRNLHQAWQRAETYLNLNASEDLDRNYGLLTLNGYNHLKEEGANRKLWAELGKYWLVLCFIVVATIIIIASILWN